MEDIYIFSKNNHIEGKRTAFKGNFHCLGLRITKGLPLGRMVTKLMNHQETVTFQKIFAVIIGISGAFKKIFPFHLIFQFNNYLSLRLLRK